MNSKDDPRGILNKGKPSSTNEIDSLKQQMLEMQLEIDILKETINVLKKDPGVCKTPLKNKEKVAIVDALKDRYSLPVLLGKLALSKSSYYYQETRLNRIDKYQELREQIRGIFYDNKSCYGYRRIHQGITWEHEPCGVQTKSWNCCLGIPRKCPHPLI